MIKWNAKVIIVMIFLSIWQSGLCQVDLSFYLPEIEYDQNIPTPESLLSYQVGEWHVTHDQLVGYMYKLCGTSDKCKITEYARSHENRPLVYLTISSPDNMKELDEIKEQHHGLINNKNISEKDITDIPIFIYQGYSIHGNESSGSNASLLLAYYLLSGKSDDLDKLLEQSVTILDPCYNPDGLQRFSSWANMNKHKNLNPDPNSREFNEVWPKGRTNHYWFDLNRDWIFNVHPESKGRIKVFHEWKPDILTDHHEMGSHSTFFFQPGIPSRTNPNTPVVNQELTEKIGTYHASFLDSIGSEYYTKESFDDYYYGKGSTYPDINGCIGILFEQASSRGHLRETKNGLLSFPFTIRNQFVTSLSTQKAAIELKDEILKYKRDFYNKRKKSDTKGAYIFHSEDNYTCQFFIDLLNRHQIEVYQLSENTDIEGTSFPAKTSYVVPKNQHQYMLAKTIFEKVYQFPDSLFYDVSAWTLPLAFNIPFAECETNLTYDRNMPVSTLNGAINPIEFKNGLYAIAAEWASYLSPAFLNQLLAKGISVKVVTEPTELTVQGKEIEFDRGTLIIPLWRQNDLSRTEVVDLVNAEAIKYSVNLHAVDSGFSPDGKSIGSPKIQNIIQPKTAIIVGEGINAYEAGSSWYQMDQRLDMALSLLDIHQNPNIKLDRYNTIILPDGKYSSMSGLDDKLKQWVRNGGILIAMRKAINYTNKLQLTQVKSKSKKMDIFPSLAYESQAHDHGSQVIGGAIFETEIDLSHPLFFGYSQNLLPVFKRGTQFYEQTKNAYATPMKYSGNPILSGYCSEKNKILAQKSAALMCFRYGSGKVIAMVDNPNFRGYWLGGSRMFANALFFGPLIKSSTTEASKK